METRRTMRYKIPYDSQVTFQLYQYQKQSLIDLVQGKAEIPGRKFSCMGDVLRDALEEYLETHDLNQTGE